MSAGHVHRLGHPHAGRRRWRAYNPMSYHNGSVWPHDNAICAAGLMRYGFVEQAQRVTDGDLRRRRGVRLPAARAVLRIRPGRVRDAGALPDVLLAAGVGGRGPVLAAAQPAAVHARGRQSPALVRAGGARPVPAAAGQRAAGGQVQARSGYRRGSLGDHRAGAGHHRGDTGATAGPVSLTGPATAGILRIPL